jgi:hypothetical protein
LGTGEDIGGCLVWYCLLYEGVFETEAAAEGDREEGDAKLLLLL